MTKLEQLKIEFNKVSEEQQKAFEEFMNMSERNIPYYEAYAWYKEQYHVKRLDEIKKEIRRLEVNLSLHPIYNNVGNHMTIKQFIDYCKDGLLIDNDGFGNYATDDKESDIKIYPSDVVSNKYRTDFSHVIWYNR